jgi:long-subunit fatty acid transport protein
LKNTFFKIFFLLFATSSVFSQDSTKVVPSNNSKFWKNVQFGGGIGLNIGSGFTNISIAPTGIYPLNDYFSVGLGLQYNYLNQNDLFFRSSQYGGNIIGIINPINEIQLSLGLEQLRVNLVSNEVLMKTNGFPKSSFWNTGLFVGAGYRVASTVIGARYNVLYKNDNGVYAQALMPFISVYF